MGILRLLLAISVVINHSTPILGNRLVGGDNAVETFYMISGFYMALVLTEKYAPGEKLSFRAAYRLFIESRLLRLFPVYLAVLALTVAVQALGFRHNPSADSAFGLLARNAAHMHAPAKAWIILSNLFLGGQDWLMFRGYDPSAGVLRFAPSFTQSALPAYRFLFVPQAWTLGVELTFYVIAPFLVRRTTGTLALIVAASFAVRIALSHAGLSADPWSYRFFPSELAFFLIGAMGYKAYRAMASRRLYKPAYGVAALAAALAAVFARESLHGHLVAIGYFVILAVAIPLVFQLTKRSDSDRLIGDLSYPVYISQLLILELIARFTHVTGVALTVATVAFSALLLLLIDRPVDRLRQRMVDRARAVPPAGAQGDIPAAEWKADQAAAEATPF